MTCLRIPEAAFTSAIIAAARAAVDAGGNADQVESAILDALQTVKRCHLRLFDLPTTPTVSHQEATQASGHAHKSSASLDTSCRHHPMESNADGRSVHSDAHDEVQEAIALAQSLGLANSLHNLAARKEMVERSITWMTMLQALQKSEGLVNKAKYALMMEYDAEKEVFTQSDAQGTFDEAQMLNPVFEESFPFAQNDNQGATGEAQGNSVLAQTPPSPPESDQGTFDEAQMLRCDASGWSRFSLSSAQGTCDEAQEHDLSPTGTPTRTTRARMIFTPTATLSSGSCNTQAEVMIPVPDWPIAASPTQQDVYLRKRAKGKTFWKLKTSDADNHSEQQLTVAS